MKLNETQITKMVYESVRKILKEGIFTRTRPEGKPQNVADVIHGNGWKAYIKDKKMRNGKPVEIIIRCYENNDAWFPTDESLPFEELVEDINIYYQGKGSSVRAYPMEEYNGIRGAFISLRK